MAIQAWFLRNSATACRSGRTLLGRLAEHWQEVGVKGALICRAACSPCGLPARPSTYMLTIRTIATTALGSHGGSAELPANRIPQFVALHELVCEIMS